MSVNGLIYAAMLAEGEELYSNTLSQNCEVIRAVSLCLSGLDRHLLLQVD